MTKIKTEILTDIDEFDHIMIHNNNGNCFVTCVANDIFLGKHVRHCNFERKNNWEALTQTTFLELTAFSLNFQ